MLQARSREANAIPQRRGLLGETARQPWPEPTVLNPIMNNDPAPLCCPGRRSLIPFLKQEISHHGKNLQQSAHGSGD
jgi:hypothetical protein